MVSHTQMTPQQQQEHRTCCFFLFFFVPPPLQTMSFNFFFFILVFDGTTELSSRVMKKGTAQFLTYLAAKHRSTEYATLLIRWSGHLPEGLMLQCHSWERLSIFLFWESHCPLGHTYIPRKICPSFPRADLGKGNKIDTVDVQGKYITLVFTNGRFWNRHLGC